MVWFGLRGTDRLVLPGAGVWAEGRGPRCPGGASVTPARSSEGQRSPTRKHSSVTFILRSDANHSQAETPGMSKPARSRRATPPTQGVSSAVGIWSVVRCPTTRQELAGEPAPSWHPCLGDLEASCITRSSGTVEDKRAGSWLLQQWRPSKLPLCGSIVSCAARTDGCGTGADDERPSPSQSSRAGR